MRRRKAFPRTGTWLPCLILYLFSAVLITWRLWLPEYVRYEAGWGIDVVRLTVRLEMIFTVLYGISLFLRANLLDTLRQGFKRSCLGTPLLTSIAPIAALLVSALLQTVVKLTIGSWELGNNLAHSMNLTLCLIYLLAQESCSAREPRKALPFRLLTVPILTALSKLLLDGFSPALYAVVTIACRDCISVLQSEKRQLGIKGYLAFVLPPAVCFGLILGAKVIFYPQVLDFQLRTIRGLANSYSLGAYSEFLRAAGLRGYLCSGAFTVAIFVGTAFLAHIVTHRRTRERIVFLGMVAFVFNTSAVLQMYCNAELAHRFMPFQWVFSGVLAALLANTIYRSGTANTQSVSHSDVQDTTKKS